MLGPRAAQNLQMPHPWDWKGGQMPRSSPGGEGEAGRSWNWLMHYSRELFLFSWYMVFGIQVVQ